MINTPSPAFEARVLARTGVALGEIPVADPSELGHILCHDKRTNTFVVFVGYPDHEDEDGIGHWPMSALRRIVVPR